MQNEKGVTLVSVILYVIVMVILITVITVLTSYFYKNMDINKVSEDVNQQYTKFNSYFTEEINKKGNKVIDVKTAEQETDQENTEETKQQSNANQQNYIIFSSGNQYTYIPNNKGIYLNNVKIAQNITNCTFNVDKSESGKTIIKVMIQGEEFEKETTYTLVE